MPDHIDETITQIVQQTLKSRGLDVRPEKDMSLIDSGMLDSLSIVTFVGELEKAFSIEVSMADMTLDNFDNIQLIEQLVRRKLSLSADHGHGS
jgi:acyl carrier protein